MEKIAEMLYNAFENFTRSNRVQEPEGFSDAERQFLQCLDQEQMYLYRNLESLSYDYVQSVQIALIKYILKLIQSEDE